MGWFSGRIGLQSKGEGGAGGSFVKRASAGTKRTKVAGQRYTKDRVGGGFFSTRRLSSVLTHEELRRGEEVVAIVGGA